MSEVGRVAVIGDRNFCAPFKVLGLSVLTPENPDQARTMLAQVVQEKYAVCLIQETWLEVLKPEVAELSHKFAPVCVGFSDFRASSESVENLMRELSIKAIGSDALFTRGRKENETR
ncbi:MAG: V-type ATP synthase subunit F [Candidatus Saccharicenans sp.]|nr:V-type ATP synthase subunit F [Candidatus Saccharicenans sp.]